MANPSPRKVELEVLLARDGRSAQEISRAAKIDPKSLWALRRRSYRYGPSDRVVDAVARALGVTPARLWAMVCDIPYKRRAKYQERNRRRTALRARRKRA